MIEADCLRAARCELDFNDIGTLKRSAPFDQFNASSFAEPFDSAGQVSDHRVLERSQLVQVDRGLGKRDAAIFSFLSFVDQLGDVQQGFEGNAAAIQADSPGLTPSSIITTFIP